MLAALQIFADLVLPAATGIDISLQDASGYAAQLYQEQLRTVVNPAPARPPILTSCLTCHLRLQELRRTKTGARKAIEAQLSLLLNVGVLTRHSASHERYLFAMPNAGPLVRSIAAGRKVTVLHHSCCALEGERLQARSQNVITKLCASASQQSPH